MKRRNKLKLNKRIVAALAVLLAVGFAYISSAVNIGGMFTLSPSRYDVHFENLQITEGSVEADTPTYSTNDTTVSASVRFTNPGDFYEFTIDAVNDGDIDAMLNTVSDVELTTDQEKYLEYKVTYEDGEELAQYQELNAGDRLTFKVRANFKEDIDTEDLPVDGDTLDLTFDTEYIRADDNKIRRRAENTLYNVLKTEAISGGLAKKYTGEHQDSMDASLSTKDIYHWYATNSAGGTAVTNKNNVIFANHCWQMIRTTDTGGAKLIYNGEVENNQCLNTRGTHEGFSRVYTSQYLGSYYWYGTNYDFDKTTGNFTLSGETEYERWGSTTNENLVGKFTCKKTNLEDTCTTLYYVYNVVSQNDGNVLELTGNSKYSQFGEISYDSLLHDSPADVGYMYNERNTTEKKIFVTSTHILYNQTLSTDFWYADSIEYGNTAANKYNLVNPYKVTSASDYSNLVGKYTFRNSDETYSATSVMYIVAVNSNNMVYVTIKDGNNLNSTNKKYTYGESYTDNGDGTFTINSPSTLYLTDYYSQYNDIAKKYVCINSTNNTCSNLIYIQSNTNTLYMSRKQSDEYKYAQGFTYDSNTGEYTLNNNSNTLWNLSIEENRNLLNNKHYTCWNKTGKCSVISYVLYYDNDLTYINLENGAKIDDLLNDILNDTSVNKTDSQIKIAIELWYEQKMLPYDEYVDDVIYCNNRSISDLGPWNPNGGRINVIGQGSINRLLTFSSNAESSDLTCSNITDRFSITNDLAKLKYKVALPTVSEMVLLNVNGIRKSGDIYWLMSPKEFDETYGSMVYEIYSDGQIMRGQVFTTNGVRPTISLKPTTFYTSGDGSMETPYVIYTE